LERRGKGLLSALAHKLESQKDLMSTASLDLLQSNLTPAVHAARDRATLVFDYLDRYLQLSNEPVARLTAAFASHPVWKDGLGESLGALLRELTLLQDGLRLVRERMEANGAPREGVASLLSEIRGVARRLESAGDALQRALVPAPGDEASLVRWLEVRGRDRNVAATAVPLDIAPILREDLFKRVTTAVVTSATLASGDRFAFLRTQLGLDDLSLDATSAIFPSPFDYPRQAMLAVPTDFPAPNVDPAGHLRSVIGATTALATASDGGLFVLFTSHRDVREVARELRARGLGAGWPLLVHGEEPRDVLLRRFRESGRAILLGTASFWEGVDVAGEALRGLVITKLPFRVPTEPLTAARSEAIEARGGDSFKELMLPHATLRLKQGFGRLIRTGTDRGAVVLCDSRASTKAYGRGILGALPPARRVVAPWNVVLRELQDFYRIPETV
jgi:ATP-dependent DNA helicase DinG